MFLRQRIGRFAILRSICTQLRSTVNATKTTRMTPKLSQCNNRYISLANNCSYCFTDMFNVNRLQSPKVHTEQLN